MNRVLYGNGSTLLLAIFLSAKMVAADLERNCSVSEHRQYFNCQMMLMLQITEKCGGDVRNPIYSTEPEPAAYGEDREEIFISEDIANAWLTIPVEEGKHAGFSCECCANRCSAQEMNQYCNPRSLQRIRERRLRARRSIRQAPKDSQVFQFTTSDVNDFYDSLKSIDGVNKELTLQQFKELSMIKSWKLENIENKLLTRYMQGRRLDKSQSTPSIKVTPKLSDDIDGNTFKTKSPQMVISRHSHKYLHRKHKNN